MSFTDQICMAISEMRLLGFTYDGKKRVVEPHQIARNVKCNAPL